MDNILVPKPVARHGNLLLEHGHSASPLGAVPVIVPLSMSSLRIAKAGR